MQTAERKAVGVYSPDLESLTTSNIERAFLSVRQELKRFQHKGLGYSKDLETHKLAVALHFGVYNFVRIHSTLGTTPAVAAGVEFERWSLEKASDLTRGFGRAFVLIPPRAGTLEPPKGTNLVRTCIFAALVHKSEITRGRNAARSALRTARTSITS
jgi:hypothetical protein